MADRSAEKRAKRRRKTGKRAPGLPKTAAAEQKAQAGLVEAGRKLRATLTAVDQARAGSARERKAHRAARAALKALVAAKKKLRKARRKQKKVAAKEAAKEAQPRPQPKAPRQRRKTPTRARRQAAKARRSPARPRKASGTSAVVKRRTRSRTRATVKRPEIGTQTAVRKAGQPLLPVAESTALRPELAD